MERNPSSILKGSLDSNDTFAKGGHQLMKTAGATRHADRMKRIPVWAMDDDKIRDLINARFPKAKEDPKQKKLAARMIRLIQLYYRVGVTRGVIASELQMSENAVMCCIYRINKEMAESLKPSHRPRKADSIQTDNEKCPVL